MTAASSAADLTAPRPRQRAAPSVVAVVVVLVGLVLTGAATAASAAVHRHSERRLLETQTRQAAAVIGATVVTIGGPLNSAVKLADVTNGDAAEFTRFMTEYTGPTRLFVAASLWRLDGSEPRRITAVGVTPELVGPPLTALLGTASRSKTFVVARVDALPAPRIAYADSDLTAPQYVVFAERAIPANRQVPVESDSAFSDLRFATYLGRSTDPLNLATTNVSPASLPLSGKTATAQIPFGNSSITLVTSATKDLGGGLGARLPWICLLGGLLVTLGTAVAAARLVSRRRAAERDEATIRGLYDRLDGLYAEQHTIAKTLQHALLPVHSPQLKGLDVACRYVAGAAGVDVGGDWYSVVEVDEQRFAFAVGDVSGRGVSAAAVMARLQFTMRAYLLEGHPPDAVLAMCATHIDLTTDGHFATAVVGVCERRTRRITLANAGHPPPLLVTAEGASYVSLPPGLPLGMGTGGYSVATIDMPPGSTLVAFTDGLVERRSEAIDTGLRRLADAAATPTGSTAEWLDRLIGRLGHDVPEDDIAVLAFTWQREPADGVPAQAATPEPVTRPSGI